MTSNWSVPETEVVAGIRDLLDAGDRGVLATVIDVEGSAYRRPGAKMLITDDDGLGSITAGCLEDEVRELARSVLEAGEPRVETYDLTGDDDVWGLGVGCNGVITVLLEPVDETYRPAVDAYDRGEATTVLTVVDGDGDGDGVEQWSRAHYDGDALTVDRGSFPAWLESRATDLGAEFLPDDRAATVTVDADAGSAEVFVDTVSPPPELVVFGNGHDVGPVVQFGKRSGFRVTVVSYRGGTTADEFPDADAVVSSSPSRVTDDHDFDENTYAVVMSHNFVDDRLTLAELLETPAPYVGLMGPHKRFEEMLEDFADEGRTFTGEARERIYTPIGLNLGGGSPYQVALSIVAEVVAVHEDRDPMHLADRDGTVHGRDEVELPGETV